VNSPAQRSAELRLTLSTILLVLSSYVFIGMMGVSDRENPNPRDAPYNLLARGLLAGHLYLDKEAPSALVGLADPYDPEANRPFTVNSTFHLHDLSYYRGRLYLYFGASPALLVFIPWHLLTGGWLAQWVAVVALCAAGLLVNVSILRSVRARVFPASPPWMSAVAVLVLGMASYAPVLLSRADMWEVPIAFNYAALSVALRCLWAVFCDASRAVGYLALASGMLGAAFAARPTVLPAAAVLLIPFLMREVRGRIGAWAAAVLPLGICGMAVAYYNEQRFGSPFEFGQHYQLAGQYVAKLKLFSPGYLPTNLRLFLFQGVRWDAIFPFAHEPPDTALPPDHGAVEHMSGILRNAPVLWAGMALIVYMMKRRTERSVRLLALASAWIALVSLLFIGLFFGATARYQFEFAPSLAVLAALGIMALETAQDRTFLISARCIWGAALAISCAFPMLYAIDRCVMDHEYNGIGYVGNGDFAAAQREFDVARLLSPGDPFSRLESGVILAAKGKTDEAIAVFSGIVRDRPDYVMAHYDLGHELALQGRLDEAIEHLRIAHRLQPGDARIGAALDAALVARERAAHP
jgi:tetratricopeptide (TPR) repeat protein